jgi:transposase
LRFLRSLLAQIPGPIVALSDGAPIHRNGAIKDFVAAHPRLLVVQFPGYAPELNPAEFVWCQTDADLANSLLIDQEHLLARLDGKRRKLKRSQPLLWSCLFASDLPWR